MSTLYKYFPPARLPVLLDRLVRFTPPGRLNDPFDMRPVILGYDTPEVVSQEIQELRPAILEQTYAVLPAAVRNAMSFTQFSEQAGHLWPRLLGDAQAFADRQAVGLWSLALRALDAAVGVMCLAEPNDAVLMWSHYSQGHTGFALGFESTHGFFHRSLSAAPTEWGRLWSVYYSEERPAIKLMEIREFRHLLTKSSAWSYEREQRIFLPLALADQVKLEGAELIHLFRFPAEALSEIVLGVRFLSTALDTVRAILLNNPDYRHVRILRAQPHAAKYSIEIVPVSI